MPLEIVRDVAREGEWKREGGRLQSIWGDEIVHLMTLFGRGMNVRGVGGLARNRHRLGRVVHWFGWKGR